MEKYHFFKNAHLKRALWLREQGKYEEALEELNLGCDDNDGQAWYAKAIAHKTGGWGLSENFDLYRYCLKKSLEYECDWGCSLSGSNEKIEFLERAKNSKDPFVMAKFSVKRLLGGGLTEQEMITAEKDAMKYSEEAFDQGNFMVVYAWVGLFYFRDSPKHDCLYDGKYAKFLHDEKWVQECAKIRDAYAMLILHGSNNLKSDFDYLEESAKQKHKFSVCIIQKTKHHHVE